MRLAAYEPCRKDAQCDSGTCKDNFMGQKNGYCAPPTNASAADLTDDRKEDAPWNVEGTPTNDGAGAKPQAGAAMCTSGTFLLVDKPNHLTCIVQEAKNICWRSAVCAPPRELR
jgi:hypothetical protein